MIRKLMLAPLAICLVPMLPGCGGNSTPATSTSSAPAATAPPKVPSTEVAQTLALDAMTHFNDAVKSKNFTKFHAQLDKSLQAKVSSTEFAKTFQSWMDNKRDISSSLKSKPVFKSAPSLNRDGQLVLDGFFPDGAYKNDFTLTYSSQSPDWKLVGFYAERTAASAK
jgi:hypothetical protein